MPRHSKVAVLAALAAIGGFLPLFGDARVTPLTHPLWARMLLRALELDDAVRSNAHASTVFDALTGRGSRVFSADGYLEADGVVASGRGGTRQLASAGGVGEVTYGMAVVQGGDYRLRARVAVDPAHPVSAEILPVNGTSAVRTFRLVPGREPNWILAGSAHLDAGTYKASLLLPSGTSLEYVELASPCVNPVEPLGGWKATAATTAEDLAVTALRALDMEHLLAPADSPVEHTGAEFAPVDGTPLAAGDGIGDTVLKAGRDGLEAALTVRIPEAGLYSLEAFVTPGRGQRWRADGCRKSVLCAGSPAGWQPVMTQSFSAGPHSFSVALAADATVERVRLTRRKESAADYMAALRRLGFDPGQGEVRRPTATGAVQFIRGLRTERARLLCGDITDPAAPAATVPTTTAGATGAQVPGAAVAPMAPVGPPTVPLTGALLPPQERASPVLPGAI